MRGILVLLSCDPAWRKHGDLSLEKAVAKLSLHLGGEIALRNRGEGRLVTLMAVKKRRL